MPANKNALPSGGRKLRFQLRLGMLGIRVQRALEASSKAIEALLRASLASGGKVKGFKPHAVAFLGYLISHESHHRGQAGWALKFSGAPLDKKTAFGLWEWGVR